ncbi:MAG TPA: protein-methionine-sulfoxide reductase catalytic subunit MsrP [Vicinamibacterales bacterium]|nr:protein-methionine-sulfoxide reductase catalytic subunit MsrP [Vicinamibacterales bacterium]
MLIKKVADLRESDVTPKELFLRRREFIAAAGITAAAVATYGVGALAGGEGGAAQNPKAQKLTDVKKSPLSTDEKLNSYKDITTYNNFYEFGLDKADPGRYAHTLKPRPWSVVVEGQCGKPGTYNIEDIMTWAPLEERIYRLRCVEAWSMVVPWIGYPMSELLKRFEPTSRAKYVEFKTLVDPKQMPGQTEPALRWPYTEGLRMDEAMHPLTLVGLGLYGEVMPNQNGAPIRLVVPWKYGFKSIKSIVRVRFTEQEPLNTWQQQQAQEYGFYANVNPQVDHPRWSQVSERRLGEFFRRKTLMFNGYADQVASLYSGMDLRKFY